MSTIRNDYVYVAELPLLTEMQTDDYHQLSVNADLPREHNINNETLC